MDEGVVIGLGTIIRAFTIRGQVEERQQAPVILRNGNGTLHLTYSTNYLPLDLFHYGESINNEVTVYFKDNNNFPYTKIVFEMGSIGVENFIDKVKLHPKPRPNTYENDGNV
jgi:hypothetical protein